MGLHLRSGRVALVRIKVVGAVPEMHRAAFRAVEARRAGRATVLNAEPTMVCRLEEKKLMNRSKAADDAAIEECKCFEHPLNLNYADVIGSTACLLGGLSRAECGFGSLRNPRAKAPSFNRCNKPVCGRHEPGIKLSPRVLSMFAWHLWTLQMKICLLMSETASTRKAMKTR